MNLTDPKNSLFLYGQDQKFDFLSNLYNLGNFPRVLMLSGKKGLGKFTLINHFLNYVFDRENYNLELKKINIQSLFFKQYLNNVYPNIIHLKGSNLKNIKIEDIRELKSKILKSNISEGKRFIVLDDVELFNINSLNALLKIIEEPSTNNYFILINNKTKPMIRTITSRCLEIKILLSNQTRIKIIEHLIENNKLNPLIDYKLHDISPGSFCVFNDICETNNINIDDHFVDSLENILNLYKKTKDINLVNFIFFLTDIFFHNKIIEKKDKFEKIYEIKNHVIDDINKFIVFNLNQKSFLNSINNRLSNG
tara:strand:- start:3091 stop:4017 length:927 start_codon:yes stop_codon:yes gene_type:complete